MAWTTPYTWTSATVTVAQLNTYIRDNQNAIIDGSAPFVRMVLTHGTITSQAPTLGGTVTWNNVAVTFKARTLAVTDSASAAASLLEEFTVGGATKWSVAKDGAVGIVGVATFTSQVLFGTAQNVTINGANQTMTLNATTNVVRLTVTAATDDIDMMTGGADGRIVLIQNVSANSYAINHDTGGTAANRFYVRDAAGVVLNQYELILARYDGTLSRWMVTHHGLS